MSILSLPVFPENTNAGVVPPRILIVEDNDTIRSLYSQFLLSAGLIVKSAGNGVQAKSLLTSFNPTILLLDLDLPDATADDLLTATATCSTGKRPTVISFSARAMNQYPAEIQPVYFLPKPVALTTLGDIVRRIMTQRTLRS